MKDFRHQYDCEKILLQRIASVLLIVWFFVFLWVRG